jgi:hypothetical protein
VNDELVTIRTYRFANHADMDRMYLESAGIPAFLADDNVVTMDWLLGNAIGNVKLQVPRSRAEEALDFLVQHEPPEVDEFENEIDERTGWSRCLSCNRPMRETETSCSHCGWTFVEEVEPVDPV